jgi:hypothetical protein
MRQRAAEAGVAKGKTEPFAKKLRWVDSRQIGQSFKGKGAVIFSVQIGIQGSPVPWDLKVYVERGTYRTTVGFFD